jgi:hypothetical protein
VGAFFGHQRLRPLKDWLPPAACAAAIFNPSLYGGEGVDLTKRHAREQKGQTSEATFVQQ